MPRPRLALPLVLISLLAACAQLPRTMPGDAPVVRAVGSTSSGFQLTGRIALSRGQERHAVNIGWQHGTDSDEIFLTTPLGQGIAELRRDASGARLTTAEFREFNATDWETLAFQVFGFPLPLSALPRWLLAEVPADALGVLYDNAGRPRRMVADGWLVSYPKYDGDGPDALPVLIELKREDIEVRLRVDDWQLSR